MTVNEPCTHVLTRLSQTITTHLGTTPNMYLIFIQLNSTLSTIVWHWLNHYYSLIYLRCIYWELFLKILLKRVQIEVLKYFYWSIRNIFNNIYIFLLYITTMDCHIWCFIGLTYICVFASQQMNCSYFFWQRAKVRKFSERSAHFLSFSIVRMMAKRSKG